MPASATASLQPVLDQLAADLLAGAGSNLLGVALYGGLAKGRFTPGISDVNVLVVVRDAGLAALEALAPILTAARRAHRVTTFVATPDDLRDAARLFPVKVHDIKAAHRVLFGDPGLEDLPIDPVALRLRARQEVRNIHFRLRLRAVERGADPAVLWGGVLRSLPKLAVTLGTIVRASPDAQPLPADRPGVLRAAAAALDLSAAMEPFTKLHRHDPPPDAATIRRLTGDYLRLLEQLGARIS